MSLASLLRHNFFTIEILVGDISVDTDGAFEGDWVPIEAFKNLRGNVQEKKKNAIFSSFGTTEENHSHLIYHRERTLFEYRPDNEDKQVKLRVITARNPRNPLSFPVEDRNEVFIYEWMGQFEQVSGIRQKAAFYVIKGSRINHLSLT